MTTRRKLLIALGTGALGVPLASFSQQQATKVARIGFLSSESAAGIAIRIEALRAGLRERGYEEGRNLVIDFRWADGKLDRLPELAAELVRLNVDVLVTHATHAIRAAKQATATIPIVIAAGPDPVSQGFVASLARPGGNITGLTFFPTEFAAKRIELIKDAFPRISQVAVLVELNSATRGAYLKAMEATARSVNVTLHEFPVRGPHEIDSAFAAMVKQRVRAVTIPDNPMFLSRARTIAELAAKQRLPLIGGGEFADAGGLIGYGANVPDLFRRAAYFVDRILKGAKPGDIPVEQSTKFDLVVNLKTAKALGIKIPETLLFRADRVIE